MKVKITDIQKGSYDLLGDNLYFETNCMKDNYSCNTHELIIDKKSALIISHTLLDSLYLLNKDTEKLLDDIENKINEL